MPKEQTEINDRGFINTEMKFIAVLLFAVVAFASAEECMDLWSKGALPNETLCEHHAARNHCVGRFAWLMMTHCTKTCGYCSPPTEAPIVEEVAAIIGETAEEAPVDESPAVETEVVVEVIVTEAPVVVSEDPVVVETEAPVVLESEVPVEVVTEAPVTEAPATEAAEAEISDTESAAAAVQAAVDAISGGVGGDEASVMEGTSFGFDNSLDANFLG